VLRSKPATQLFLGLHSGRWHVGFWGLVGTAGTAASACTLPKPTASRLGRGLQPHTDGSS